MKKIAFVFDGLEQGGIERIGVDYVRMCRELGYEVDVYNLAPKHYVTAQFLPKDVKVFNKDDQFTFQRDELYIIHNRSNSL